MTATDELRKMLDERGVEWLNSDGDCCDSDDDYMLAEQDSRKTTWSVDIAGDDMTITAHEVYENDELEEWFDLEFHEYFTLKQVIAATLGGGECKLHECEGSFSATNRPVWRCDCGAFMTQYTDATTYHKPRFCPNCGRKVKR